MTILVIAEDVISEMLTQFNLCIKCKIVCWEDKKKLQNVISSAACTPFE